MSTLQSKYDSGTAATSIDNAARWLSRVILAVAIIMIGWGLTVILTQPVTTWFAISSIVLSLSCRSMRHSVLHFTTQ